CGAIAYEADLDTDKVGICHCTDCQALSASAFRTVAIVDGDKFRLTKGTPKIYVKLGDSGNPRNQAFCPDCGSALYASEASDTPTVYNVRVGTVRQRNDLSPKFEVFRSSAMPWLPDVEGTAIHERGAS
ncbi:unnamed protein product, partial [Discosporangium mesarthrocarpum]